MPISPKLIRIVVLILALGIAGGVWYWGNIEKESDTGQAIGDDASWKKYRNEEYGFEVNYPPDFKLNIKESTSEEIEKKGYKLSLTLNIEDPKVQIPKAESVSGLEYFRLYIWKNDGSYDALFQGPFPRTTKPSHPAAGTQQMSRRVINNFDGIEQSGHTSEGHLYDDLFYYKNDFVWEVMLNPVFEGKITLSEWQKIVPGGWPEEIRNNIQDNQIYKGILSSFRLVPQKEKASVSSAQSSAASLRSKFLKDDAAAQSIVQGGTTNYSIQNFQTFGSFTRNDTTSFAFKFLNGLIQLGYIISNGVPIYPIPAKLKFINNFQKDYNLSQSEFIDKQTLLKLDELLASRENEEESKGNQFPLCGEFGPAPRNWPSKEHLCFLYYQVFKSLPDNLAPWTKDNFTDFFAFQYSNPTRQQIDSNYYHPDGLIHNSDYEAMYTLVHEYAHQIDVTILGIGREGPTRSFYDISWNKDNTPKYDFNSDVWISRYAGAGVDILPDNPGYSDDYREDFAESFATYVLNGKIFRVRALESPILKQKYEWLKINMFNGREYDTGSSDFGDIDFSEFFPDGQKHRPDHGDQYYTFNPDNYKWNFQIPPVTIP